MTSSKINTLETNHDEGTPYPLAPTFEKHLYEVSEDYKPSCFRPPIHFRIAFESADWFTPILQRWDDPEQFLFSRTSDDRQIFSITRIRKWGSVFAFDSRLEYDTACEVCAREMKRWEALNSSNKTRNEHLPPPYDSENKRLRKPCYDIFMDLDRIKELNDIVAFKSPNSKKICFRDDWCWETLSRLHEDKGYVAAVYADTALAERSSRLWKMVRVAELAFAFIGGRIRLVYISDLKIREYEILQRDGSNT